MRSNDRGMFKVYLFENSAAERVWKDGELYEIKARLLESSYANQELIGFACSFADVENGCTKVWYFNPEIPFIVNGPLALRNRDLSVWELYEFDDSIGLHLPSGNIQLPEATCWAESQVVAHEQERMGQLGYTEYRKLVDDWIPSPEFSQSD